jgi:hypothetical protein
MELDEDDDAGYGIQKLVLLHGRERARELVPANQRSLVDIAAEVLSDDSRNIGITYAGFCLTSLPHKKLPDSDSWHKHGHKVSLLVEPGSMIVKGREVKYGVPYGARARVILLFLQTQAVKTRSPIAQRDEAEAEALARRHARRGYELRLNAIAVVTKAGPQNRMEQRLRLPENHAETLTNTPADRAALAVPLTSINRRSIP